MTSRHVITGRATSTGCSVTRLCHGSGNCRMQTMSPVPHALAMSQVSVTKASGLSNAPGAERSPNGKWRYRDT